MEATVSTLRSGVALTDVTIVSLGSFTEMPVLQTTRGPGVTTTRTKADV